MSDEHTFDHDFADPAEFARMYRSHGFQVVPAMSHRESPKSWKRPALAQWLMYQHILTSDDQFKSWYGEGGEHIHRNNMGVITGACSGNLIVVDRDTHKHPEADEWWKERLAEEETVGELETVEQITGGGGVQHFYHAPPGRTVRTCKTNIGVDVRGPGGFAMLPPSMHESGTPYRWKPGHAPSEMKIAVATPRLLDAIDRLTPGDGGATRSAPLERISAVGTTDDFGFTIDGREQKIRDMVWARLADLRRENLIRPNDDVFAAEREDLLASYLRTTKTRIPAVENVSGLEQEGRGPSAFHKCWRRALKKWDTEIAEAAKQAVSEKRGDFFGEDEVSNEGTSAESHTKGLGRHVRRSVNLVHAADIPPEKVVWLWQGHLAEGKMHILAGAPGSGKTTIALRLAAIVSAGASWPDGTYCPAGNVVIWSGEDDIKDTLVPRLIAAGADVNRIHFVGDVRDAGGVRSFDLSQDVLALQQALQAVGGASLMIVDPIVSAVAGDGHKAGDVRRGLQPLVDLAMAERCALFGITHFSKGTSGNDPLERVTGSVSFGALARVVFVAAKEQEGDAPDLETQPRRLFLRCKSNIGPDSGGFEYTLEQKSLDGYEGMFASVASFGVAVEGNTKTILSDAEADPSEGDGGALSDAKDWLFDFLLDGPRAVIEVKKLGAEAGHSLRTIRRAKGSLKVQARKSSLKGGWEWFNPGAMSEFREGGQENLKGATLQVKAPFGNVGHLRAEDDLSGFEF